MPSTSSHRKPDYGWTGPLTDALPDLSRSRVKQLINEGLVTTGRDDNGPPYRVKHGDSFEITIRRPRIRFYRANRSA